jgi:hypothetical protein
LGFVGRCRGEVGIKMDIEEIGREVMDYVQIPESYGTLLGFYINRGELSVSNIK